MTGKCLQASCGITESEKDCLYWVEADPARSVAAGHNRSLASRKWTAAYFHFTDDNQWHVPSSIFKLVRGMRVRFRACYLTRSRDSRGFDNSQRHHGHFSTLPQKSLRATGPCRCRTPARQFAATRKMNFPSGPSPYLVLGTTGARGGCHVLSGQRPHDLAEEKSVVSGQCLVCRPKRL